MNSQQIYHEAVPPSAVPPSTCPWTRVILTPRCLTPPLYLPMHGPEYAEQLLFFKVWGHAVCLPHPPALPPCFIHPPAPSLPAQGPERVGQLLLLEVWGHGGRPLAHHAHHERVEELEAEVERGDGGGEESG